MPNPARVGVFLCRGGLGRSESLAYKQLRWAAETGAPGGRLYEISKACQPQGAAALARLTQEHGLTQVLLGACPLARPAGPLAEALAQKGLDPSSLTLVDVCQRPAEGMEQCLVERGAHFALCQALAALQDRQEPEPQAMPTRQRVLVIGAGLAALRAVSGLVQTGREALLLTPDKRLAPPEPLLGPEAAQAAAELAQALKENPRVTTLPRGRLLGLAGSAGAFQALLRDQEERLRTWEVGAVIVAQGPPLELNAGPWELAPSPRLMSLESLAALAAAPQHLAKLLRADAPRVGLGVGLGREAGPLQLRAALRLGRLLIQELDAEVTLFTRNLKVAAPDLEELSQAAKSAGLRLVKFTAGALRPQVAPDRVLVEYCEEILERDLRQEFDLMALDQRPAPDPAYAELARCLGLSVQADGALQPDAVNALPTLSLRGGVFLVGAAQGSRDLANTFDQVDEALWQVRQLLGADPTSLRAGMVKVDRKACALCLTCLRVCPQGAMGRVERRPVANPLVCTGCGTCAAECPMNAIQLLNLEDARYQAEIKAGLGTAAMAVQGELGRELLVLACANSAGQALQDARLNGAAWPQEARLVRVPCAGKIDPEEVLWALREGFDSILVLACHDKACYSLTGNAWAGLRLEHLRALLKEAGFAPERLMSAKVAPSMSREVMGHIEKALEVTRKLGPSPLKIEARVRDLLSPYTLRMDRSYTIL